MPLRLRTRVFRRLKSSSTMLQCGNIRRSLTVLPCSLVGPGFGSLYVSPDSMLFRAVVELLSSRARPELGRTHPTGGPCACHGLPLQSKLLRCSWPGEGRCLSPEGGWGVDRWRCAWLYRRKRAMGPTWLFRPTASTARLWPTWPGAPEIGDTEFSSSSRSVGCKIKTSPTVASQHGRDFCVYA